MHTSHTMTILYKLNCFNLHKLNQLNDNVNCITNDYNTDET